MGHQQDVPVPCGRQIPSPANPMVTVACSGSKSTVYKYDDHGNCIDQQSYPCGNCGQQ
nr:hypothetical protein OG409_08060 [Streptomyces sp. NBC_00974]